MYSPYGIRGIALTCMAAAIATIILDIIIVNSIGIPICMIKRTYPDGSLEGYYGPFVSVEDAVYKPNGNKVYACKYMDGSVATIVRDGSTTIFLNYLDVTPSKDIEYE